MANSNIYSMGTVNVGNNPVSTGVSAFQNQVNPKSGTSATPPVTSTVSVPGQTSVAQPSQAQNPVTVTSKNFVDKVVTPAQQAVTDKDLIAFNQQQVNAGKQQNQNGVQITPAPIQPKITIVNTRDNGDGTSTQIMSDGTQKTVRITTNTDGTTNTQDLTPLDAAKVAAETAYNKIQTDANAAINQLNNVSLTPDQQNQVQALTDTWNNLIAQQRITNQAYEGGITTLGVSSGRNRYAPEVELGNIQAAANLGIAKIAELESKKNQAINELRQALIDKNAERIKDAYNILNDANKAQATYKQKLLDTLTEQTNKIQEQQATAKLQEDDDKRNLIADASLSPGVPASYLQKAQYLPYAQAAALLAPYVSVKAPGVTGEYAAYRNDAISKGEDYVGYGDYVTAKDRAAYAKQLLIEQYKNSSPMSFASVPYEGTPEQMAQLGKAERQIAASKNVPNSKKDEVLAVAQSDGLPGVKTWAYNNMLSAAQQKDFDTNNITGQTYSYLADQLAADPSKEDKYSPAYYAYQSTLKFLNLPHDEAYVSLMTLLQRAQSGQINQLYGTALTSGESSRANAFFVSPQSGDNKQDMIIKLRAAAAMADFSNDTTIANKLGLERPDLQTYLELAKAPTGKDLVQNSQQQYNTIVADKANQEAVTTINNAYLKTKGRLPSQSEFLEEWNEAENAQ